MSYPGRPPMMQGLPMYAMPIGGPTTTLLPTVVPIQHVPSAPHIRVFPKLNANRNEQKANGPAVTVFVGNITERAPDTMIRQILAACGHVISWKKVKAFGFCELAGPDAGLRAVRLLHNLTVYDKRLVAKVDSKTQAVLDEYKAERQKKKRSSPLQDEPEEELDEETQYLDALARDRIKQILNDYKEEMDNYEHKKEAWNKVLAEAEVEEEKRDLISREIGKFREIMKKQEEEREVKKREKNKDEERSSTRSPTPKRRNKDERSAKKRRRSRSRSHISQRSSERSRERERDRDREREREKEKERERERERERDREKERERERERDKEKDRVEKLSSKELMREKEMDDEAKEKKKADRKAREKEAAYQERLRAWETRERRKAKDYEKDRERERVKEEEREHDAKKLKEFLEDYDDERDDVKYYRGRELQRRIDDRLKEAETDTKDRLKEKEEMEDLRKRIFAENHSDPNEAFEKARKEKEEQYKPKILIDVNLDHWKQKEREKERELERQKAREREKHREIERDRRHKEEREKYIVAQAAKELEAVEAEPIDSDSDIDNSHFSPPLPELEDDSRSNDISDSPQWTQIQAPEEDSRQSGLSPGDHLSQHTPTVGMKITLSKPTNLNNQNSPNQVRSSDSRKKKIDLRDVFNPDEDDNNVQIKKRKLIPLDYDDKKTKKDKENGERKIEDAKTQEEKRKHIKTLIEKIPTDKEALFAYELDWTQIDNGLMEKKIRPWINKKIIEYIGEPEPTLVDFICNKVLAGSLPQTILEDVQMVLDEEAEVFVVKMWRLLIYEVEAKKLGLVK